MRRAIVILAVILLLVSCAPSEPVTPAANSPTPKVLPMENANTGNMGMEIATPTVEPSPTAIPGQSFKSCDWGETGMQTIKYTINADASLECTRGVLRAPTVEITLPTRTMSLLVFVNTQEEHIEYLIKRAFKVSCTYNGETKHSNDGWFNLPTGALDNLPYDVHVECVADKYVLTTDIKVYVAD